MSLLDREPQGATREATPASWYALAVLVLVTLAAVVDRQIFVLMAEPIRLHFQLTDFQLGLLQGLGVALFAAVMGYPLGWLADRFDRRYVLAGCVLLWNISLLACGLARGFGELLVASAAVGAGESGLLPIVYALLPDLFKGQKRVVANSVYSGVGRFAASAGIAICGWIVYGVDLARPLLPAVLRPADAWRLAIFAAAVPAPVMIVLILSIKTPSRPPRTSAAGEGPQPSASLMSYVARHPRTMLGTFAGIALVGLGFNAIANWIAAIVMRLFGSSPEEVGNGLGAASMVATVAGAVISVYGMRRFAPRFGPRFAVRVMWLSSLSGALTSIALLFAKSALHVYVLQGLQLALIMTAIMIYPTAMQDLSPPELRSRVFALGGVIGIVMGSLGPVIVGAVSDFFGSGANALLGAAVGVATFGTLAGAVLLWWVEGAYESTVADARASDPIPVGAAPESS